MSASLQTDTMIRQASSIAFNRPAASAGTTAVLETFVCTSRAAFQERLPAMFRQVSDHGYALIEAWDAEQATLKDISEHFGQVQSHIRADANGLVGISIDTVVNREWENFRSEYHGVSTEEFLPHTDGSYLHGLVHRDGKYVQLLPPGMLFLQCWRQAPPAVPVS